MFEAWGLPIVIGLTMLAVAYYFLHASNRLGNTLKNLYEVNQAASQDALVFIRQAWPPLSAMSIQGVSAELDWFGEPVSIVHGVCEGHAVRREIKEGELKAKLDFYCPAARGEKKILTDLVIQTFVLIISSDFSVKRQQVLATRERLSRQQLFGQHDANNLVQFLSLLNEQLLQANNDKEKLSLANQIKPMLPAVMARADRLQRDIHTQIQGGDRVDINLAEFLQKLAASINVPITITGEAKFKEQELPLHEALKNVLENFKQHQQRADRVQVNLDQNDANITIEIVVSGAADPKLPPAERMFEPFFTTSDSGMGLGLYLARIALQDINANIQLIRGDNYHGFSIAIQLLDSAVESG